MKIRVQIRGFSHRGEGVGVIQNGGSLSGLTVFVPGTVPGETVEAQVLEKKRNYARARLARVLEPGPGRTEEVCPVAGRCGGCSWQHLRYDAQLLWKEKILRDALTRIGKSPECEVRPTVPSPKILGYRNKVEVPLRNRDGNIVAGFYEPYSHNVVPAEDCPLEHPLAREMISALVEEIRARSYNIYDERTGKGLVRHVVARVAAATGERMGMIVATTGRLPGAYELAAKILRSLEGTKSLILNVNREITNVILGDRCKLLAGRWYIEDRLSVRNFGILRFRIGPLSFYQVNHAQTERLYETALEACELRRSDVVFDLYCGIGTMTLFAAGKAQLSVGVEEARTAVEDADENRRLNDIDNAVFVAGRAERVLPSVVGKYGRPDVVLLDPPRAGVEDSVVRVIADLRPRTIVYVSCNPSTLARDVARFKTAGYYPVWAVPVDMFPMTAHVESVLKLIRRG